MAKSLPDLSRFELQCLARLWARGEASVREVHGGLPKAPSYSTVRKIFERLEQKGAIARVRLEGRAWIYRSVVTPKDVIRRELRRLLDGLFDGRGAPLVAHLADLDAVSLEDLQAVEERLRQPRRGRREEARPRRSAAAPSRTPKQRRGP